MALPSLPDEPTPVIALMPRRSASLLHKTAWSGIAGVLNMGGSFLCGIIVARVLKEEGTGQITYIATLAGFLAILIGLGLPQAMSRYLPEFEASGKAGEAAGFSRTALRIYLAGMLICCAGVWIFRSHFAKAMPTPLLVWLFLGFFIVQSLSNFYTGYLTGKQKFILLAWLMAIGSTLQIIGIVIGAKFFGVAGAVFGNAMNFIVPAILVLALLTRRSRAAPDATDRGRIVKFARDTWLAGIVSAVVWSNTEIFFLEHYWSSGEVGMYRIGLILANLATQGPLLLLGALMPHLAELIGAKNFAGVRNLFASATRLLSFLLFPSCFITAAVIPVMLPAIYGMRFAPAVPNAIVLVMAAAVGAASSAGSSLQYAMERSYFIFWLGLISAFVSVALCLAIIPHWGAWGAAWVRAILQCTVVGLGQWYIAARMDCPVPVRAVAGIVAASLAGAAAAYGLQYVGPAFVGVPIALLVGGSVYLLVARILKVLNKDDVDRLRRVVAKVPGPLLPLANGLFMTAMGSPS